MRRSRWHLSIAALLTAASLVVVACGNIDDDKIVAPDGSTIVIDPAGWTRELGGAGSCSVYEEGPVFNLTLRNKNGVPLNDLNVFVSRSNPGIAFYVNGVPEATTAEIRVVTDDNGIGRFRVAIADCAGNTIITAASGTASKSIDVKVTSGGSGTNTPPVAAATVTPSTGQAGVQVFSFDGTGSTDADADTLTYTWDFGDTTTATGATTTHTYASPGSYNATLTVDDGNGGTDTFPLPTITVTP
jgi:hypothetical protein